MNTTRTTLALALLLALPLLASAQTLAGSDDFNDGTLTIGSGQRWVSTSGGAGTFSESGGVLNYTSSGEGTQLLRWTNLSSVSNAFANDWTANVTISNNTNPAGGYTTAGIEIYTGFEQDSSIYYNAYYAIMVIDNPANGGIVTEWAKYDEGLDDLAVTSNFIGTGATSDITLRLDWAAASSVLTASYSSNGIDFTTGQSFNLAGAEAGYAAPYNNTFGLELFARSAGGAGAVAGGITYDNMGVSAVPEPSTYAALAGLGALGLVFWRRRKLA